MNKALRKEFESSTKLSQLLEIAIREVEQIIKTKKRDEVGLDMSQWIWRANTTYCSVCMAGAILFNMLDKENLDDIDIENAFEGSPRIKYLCFVIDDLRKPDFKDGNLDEFLHEYYSKKVREQMYIYLQSINISYEIREWYDVEKSLIFYKKFAKDLKEIEKGDTT